MSIVKPDIFITGVMKGGTTVLHEYICTHPHVQSAIQKEIHYFSLYYDKGLDWYLNQFVDVEPGCRTIDASPTYFDVANTSLIPRLIKAFTEDPRVMLITRDPIERAISQFVHLKKTTSTEALADVDIDEFFQQSINDAFCQTSTVAYYLNLVLNFSIYTRKFRVYQQELPQNQFLVLDNQQLRESPKEVMEKVFAFLDLDYVDNELFGVVKYSNGSSIQNISEQTFNRLAELLYPDYEVFCNANQIAFKPLTYNNG